MALMSRWNKHAKRLIEMPLSMVLAVAFAVPDSFALKLTLGPHIHSRVHGCKMRRTDRFLLLQKGTFILDHD